jgi:uncharacterized membrane protein YedE/YeeE
MITIFRIIHNETPYISTPLVAMLTVDPFLLTAGNFTIGMFLGCVFFRGDFCMVALLRDFYLIRDATLLRAFLLYLVVAALLFHLLSATGQVAFFPPLTLAPASLATLAGGFVFGVGMVLAGGCVIGTIYKMAGGNLTNWIGFAGILCGSMIYAEIHPVVRQFASQSILTDSVLIFQEQPWIRLLLLTSCSVLGIFFLLHWKKMHLFNVRGHARGYLEPWKVAILLALANTAYYFLSGAPMGVTTAYAKLAAYIENVFAFEHVAGLMYFQKNSISWTLGKTLFEGGAGPRVDFISYTELALVGGIFIGALATSLYYREFKIYGFPPLRQGIAALLGGILLGLGARIASGCNVKFFLGALPLLAYQGLFFFGAAAFGAFWGTKILTQYVIR